MFIKMVTRSFESHTVVGKISAIFGRSFAQGTGSGPRFFLGGDLRAQRKNTCKHWRFCEFYPKSSFRRDEDGILCSREISPKILSHREGV